MSKVMVHATMSLDGFIAKPDDDVSWSFKYNPDAMIDEVMNEIGAVVCGGRLSKNVYEDENAVPYGGMLKIPVFVVTHAPGEPAIIGGMTYTFINSIGGAVELARVAAGEKRVAVIGASIGQQCLQLGLVDEIMLHLAPILLGEGIRLFDHLGARSIELERTEIVATSGITSMRFRVVK